MLKETVRDIRVQIQKTAEGSQAFDLDLTSKGKRDQWRQALFVGGFHLLLYRGIFYDLGLHPIHQWGVALSYAFGNLWLYRKWQLFLNRLAFVHPSIVTRLQEEEIEVSQIFEQLRPSKRYWLESSLATLVMALIDLRLGWLDLPSGFWCIGAFMVGIVKLECLYDFAKEYRQKKTQFGHLVSDYALEQKEQNEQLKPNPNTPSSTEK